MSIFFGFIIFLLGLLIGSFLNVLIDRLPNGESILGRSHCEFCKKELRWKDLFPLLSFAYLKGKCRFCKTELSYQYPALELITGFMFAFTYGIMNYELGIMGLISLFYGLFVVSVFIVIFFADLKYGIIPDKVILPAIVVSFIYLIINNPPAGEAGQQLIINHLLSAVGAFLFFLFIFLITKAKGMGFGDVKLAFLLGLILGFPGAPIALYIAFLTGGVTGFILILWKKKSMKYAVPFGPFLILGALISFFFENQLIPKIMALLS